MKVFLDRAIVSRDEQRVIYWLKNRVNVLGAGFMIEHSYVSNGHSTARRKDVA